MAPKKPARKTAPASVDQLHRKITDLGKNIRSHTVSAKQSVEKPSVGPKKRVKFAEPEIPEAPPVVFELADNPYAREIFMSKTNIREIAKDMTKGSANSKEALLLIRNELYRKYVSDPKERIRDPLYKLRFESQYYEYRFFLALNKPLYSEEQYQEYKELLEAAAVKESWVSMRDKHNRLLRYEEIILTKLKKGFNDWSSKLNKLEFYLMDLHEQQAPKAAAEKISEDVQLLDSILKRSNAKDMYNEAQIRDKFDSIKANLLAPVRNGFDWLIFNDDKLNKRFRLGTHRPEAVEEIEVVDTVPPEEESTASSVRPSSVASGDSEIAPLRLDMEVVDAVPPEESTGFSSRPSSVASGDSEIAPLRLEMEVVDTVPPEESTGSSSRPSSVASGNSEIAQMRSEMAMTQPQELLPMEVSRFADTIELVSVLGPAVELPPLPKMGTVGERLTEPNATEERQELSPMITPAQVDVLEISNSPVKDGGMVEVKEEFIFTLEYMKKFTNIEQCVMDKINRTNSPNKAKRCMRHLDAYVEKYYKHKENMLLQNVLPKELRMLTRKERRERQARAVAAVPDINRSRAPSMASDALEPPAKMEISPHTETPSVPRVARKLRLIVYEEEEQPNEPPPKATQDTLPMPNSEDFLPSAFSTQLPPGDSGVPPRRQDTPFQSPVNQVPAQCASAPPSRGPTPAFASHSPDTTVIANPQSPRKTPPIKRELNSTSYEGEVEYVEVSNAPILIDESLEVTSQNIPELLGRQPSCHVAFPDNLRGMVSTLFQENRDTTLSQGSKASSGSSGGRSRLSQDTANAFEPSMGFHQASGDAKLFNVNQLSVAILFNPNGKCQEILLTVPRATKSEPQIVHQPAATFTASVKRSLSEIIPSPAFRLVSDPFRASQFSQTLRFLTRPDIVTVDFYRNPPAHHQRHHLAVTLNHRGCRLTVADHEVRKLLNLTGGERGWRALVGTLNRVGRFQYDRFRCPSAFQFHQMSISEKIVYLLCNTFPDCSQGPGWMLRFNDVRNFEGENVRLEEFNCFLHTATMDEIDLSEGVNPYIVQRMRAAKWKMSHPS